jgi:hypothetical protein
VSSSKSLKNLISPRLRECMLGENGTVRNKGGKRYINPTHLVILIRLDKIKSVLLTILYYGQRTKKDSEF